MVLGENVFVERVLPAGTLLRLNDEEMDAYRRKVSTVMIVIDTAERISAAFDVVEERTSEGSSPARPHPRCEPLPGTTSKERPQMLSPTRKASAWRW